MGPYCNDAGHYLYDLYVEPVLISKVTATSFFSTGVEVSP